MLSKLCLSYSQVVFAGVPGFVQNKWVRVKHSCVSTRHGLTIEEGDTGRIIKHDAAGDLVIEFAGAGYRWVPLATALAPGNLQSLRADRELKDGAMVLVARDIVVTLEERALSENARGVVFTPVAGGLVLVRLFDDRSLVCVDVANLEVQERVLGEDASSSDWELLRSLYERLAQETPYESKQSTKGPRPGRKKKGSRSGSPAREPMPQEPFWDWERPAEDRADERVESLPMDGEPRRVDVGELRLMYSAWDG